MSRKPKMNQWERERAKKHAQRVAALLQCQTVLTSTFPIFQDRRVKLALEAVSAEYLLLKKRKP